MAKIYQALETAQQEDGTYSSTIVEKQIEDIPDGKVLIRVEYSSLNYKDALSAKGNKGVTRNYPHTPGIDAAGTVEVSSSPLWKSGDQVLVTGFDLGMNTNGGFGQYIVVPESWIIKLPEGLTAKEAMIYGTAGFTAGLSVQALLRNGITPEKGTVAVSGSTGGVGSVAVAILAKLGFQVAAISSKEEAIPFLKSLGAAEIISRQDFEDNSGNALLKPHFSAAKVLQKRQSMTINRNDKSTSISTQLDSLIPASKISTLTQGMFVGTISDNFDERIEQKIFHAEIVVENEKVAAETKAYQKIPQILSFVDERGTDNMKQEIERNYRQIKSDIMHIVTSELERIKSDPNLQHLVQQE
ncbi:MAG: hypothetical protein DI622_13425 [Chryseobacterium sp.]|nr:MAG: hypothetical protein DI622_13425 [Chryseobacterium sp.]